MVRIEYRWMKLYFYSQQNIAAKIHAHLIVREMTEDAMNLSLQSFHHKYHKSPPGTSLQCLCQCQVLSSEYFSSDEQNCKLAFHLPANTFSL